VIFAHIGGHRRAKPDEQQPALGRQEPPFSAKSRRFKSSARVPFSANVESVNGQYCRDCTEVARAKRGEDVRHTAALQGQDSKELARLASAERDRSARDGVEALELGVNRPTGDALAGSRLNLYA
jgi:hypothetical protein